MRRWLIISSLLLSAASAFAQANVTVQVTYTDGRPVAQYTRVEFFSLSRQKVAEAYTNGQGQVSARLGLGEYKLRITGPDIVETNTNVPIVITRGMSFASEFAQVQPLEERSPISTQTQVSAAVLNIPKAARAEFDKGMEAASKQRMEEAAARFNKALELYPKYAAAHNNLAVMSMQAGRIQEGEERFRKAIAADPEYAPAYTYLAKIIARSKPEEAASLLQKGISMDPQNPDSMLLLSMVQYQLRECIATVRKLHEMNHEGFAYAHFVAGSALEGMQRPEEAIQQFEQYLLEAPTGGAAAQAREAIAQAKKVAGR